ncbi:MAG: alpha/beta fold hydrolase [Candidatus Hydrogenedentes bacterium]|nr:alpha/beta fold hydrolase [Candidatus Hydrogenedentota bacterium]
MLRLILMILAMKTQGDATFYNAYDPKTPLNATVASEEDKPDYHVSKVYFDTLPGERVPALVTRPLQFEGKLPCIVFLHGIGQEGDFLEEITGPFNQHGFAMASFDQLGRGERRLPKDKGYFSEAKAFRRRAAMTVIDTRRLLDYLVTRPDIDPERLYLVGASYGAITGATAAAFDKRFKAVVLVYGGGDIPTLLSAPMITEVAGKWIEVAKPIMEFYVGVSDPLRYIGKISPRPVLLQNGSRDRLVDPRAGKKLQEACREPKTISWYDSDHIGFDYEVVLQVLDEALQWLLKQDGRAAA